MRNQTALFLILVVAMIVLLAIAWYTWPRENTPTVSMPSTATTSASASSSYPPPVLGEPTAELTIGGQTIYADLAENPAQQELGLGNREGLGADQGMLFIFPNDAQHMFWMKDMSFSIDMIWMSDDGTIIYIQPNVAPDTYPQAFGPSGASRYVLEVPANFAQNHGINVGDKAVLP